jgi:hypothetical protein
MPEHKWYIQIFGKVFGIVGYSGFSEICYGLGSFMVPVNAYVVAGSILSTLLIIPAGACLACKQGEKGDHEIDS